MRDLGIFIAIAASVAALIISLVQRNCVARRTFTGDTSSRDEHPAAQHGSAEKTLLRSNPSSTNGHADETARPRTVDDDPVWFS